MFITLAEGSFVTAFLKAFFEAHPIPADIATRESASLTLFTSLLYDIFIITPYSIWILFSSSGLGTGGSTLLPNALLKAW